MESLGGETRKVAEECCCCSRCHCRGEDRNDDGHGSKFKVFDDSAIATNGHRAAHWGKLSATRPSS